MKIPLLVGCLWIAGGGFVTRTSAQTSAPEFKVTIIAVTQFKDPQLQDEQLNRAHSDAANALKAYFENKFKISADLFTVADETSSEFLRTWLFNDLRRNSLKAVHLIFVLTHGFAEQLQPATNEREIFLATSDTFKTKYVGKAIRGNEFIEAFRRMPKRATAFLFLDSCGSGSIDSDNVQKILVHEPEFASRVMILAASHSDESAYGARFSKILATIWQSEKPERHCGPRHIANFLTSSVKSIEGVSPDVKQTIRVVAPMSPDFCLEDFNYQQRLLMLYNAAPGDVIVNLQADDGQRLDPPVLIKKDQMAPINLRGTNYTMVAKWDPPTDTGQIVKTIDLTSTPAKVEVLFSSDELDTVEANSTAMHYLESREIFPMLSALLRVDTQATVVRNVAANVNAILSTVSSTESHAMIDAMATRSDVAAKRAQVEEARQARDRIAQQLNACNSNFLIRPTCLPLVGALQQGNSELGRAESIYREAEQRADITQKRVTDLLAIKADTSAKALRIQSLESTAAEYDARMKSKTVEDSVATALTSSFPGVQRNYRGVIVRLSGIARSKALAKIVEIANKYPGLQTEIEVVQPGKGSLQEQLSVRRRATLWKERFTKAGLSTSAVAARGLISTRDKTSGIQVILSLP